MAPWVHDDHGLKEASAILEEEIALAQCRRRSSFRGALGAGDHGLKKALSILEEETALAQHRHCSSFHGALGA